MNARKPAPLYDHKPRPVCPVCGHTTYSRAGIHPQCSRQAADEQRMTRIKAKREAAPAQRRASSSEAVKPWHKRCPKCHTDVHIRRSNCDCGFRFVRQSRG